MERLATAFSKKGFTMLEFLVSLIILTLTAIALFNTVVFMLHYRVKQTIKTHVADAALNLVAYPGKLNNCNHGDPCQNLLDNCPSSISCSNDDVCTDNNTCVICYTNPDNGRKIYYGFNATQLSEKTYAVNLCWVYAGENGNYTTVISLPKY